MNSLRRLWVILILVFAFAACGRGGMPLSDFLTRVVDNGCDGIARCGVYPDKATCLATVRLFDQGEINAEVNSGKVKYDGNVASDCLAAAGSSAGFACNRNDQTDPDATVLQVCRAAFKGTIADGAACFMDEECVSGNCDLPISCNASTMCCTGTCSLTVVGPVAAGGDCSASVAVCASETFCKANASGTGRTCVTRAALGQPCTSFAECAAGAICSIGTTVLTGICGKLPATGETCAPSLFFSCDFVGDYCDPTTLKCTPTIAVGGACTQSKTCVAYASCDSVTSTCVALGLAGASCTSTLGCLGSLQCTNGVCAFPPARSVCL